MRGVTFHFNCMTSLSCNILQQQCFIFSIATWTCVAKLFKIIFVFDQMSSQRFEIFWSTTNLSMLKRRLFFDEHQVYEVTVNKIYSRLLRCSTARGLNTGLFHAGPTMVKAFYTLTFPLKLKLRTLGFTFKLIDSWILDCLDPHWNVMPHTDLILVLGFVTISLYGYYYIFLSPALHYRARFPARDRRPRDCNPLKGR